MLLLTFLLTLANLSALLPSVVRNGFGNVAATTDSLDTTESFDNVNNTSSNNTSVNDTSGNDTSGNFVIATTLLASSTLLADYLGNTNSKTVIDMKKQKTT